MTTSDSTRIANASLARDPLDVARNYLGGRRALLIPAVVALIGGLSLNWNWLAAVGIAPLLLTALPCLVMCGLGLCMNKRMGGSCTSAPTQSKTSEPIQPGATTNIVGTKDPASGQSALQPGESR